MIRKRPGYILLLVLMIIGMMSLLVTRLVLKLSVFDRLNTVLLRREQAKLLALSGLEMALAQLTAEVPDFKKKARVMLEELQKQNPRLTESDAGIFVRTLFELRKIITLANRWQKVELTEEQDGIEGKCAFYIACEEGKINANAPQKEYDAWYPRGYEKPPRFEKSSAEEQKTLITSAQQTLTDVLMKKLAPWGPHIDMVKRIEQVVHKQGESLNDITELLQDEQLKKLSTSVFMTPDPEQTFALTDLLSVERKGIALQPWALSKSIERAFDLKRVLSGPLDEEQWNILSDAFTKKAAGPAVWDELFNMLYGEDRSTTIKDLYPLFNIKFEADLFSVISYGSYTDVVVTLYAVVQLHRVTDQDGIGHIHGFVKRVYWIYDGNRTGS